MGKLIVIGALGATLVAGCGGGEETVTVTEEARPAVVDTDNDGIPDRRDRDPYSARNEEGSEASELPPPDFSRPVPKRKPVRVPNVVGLNHQYAQDTLQDRGFYNLDERDCSGQDRFVIWDRNWQVLEQDPPAGARVASKDRRITLCSVKEGEQ